MKVVPDMHHTVDVLLTATSPISHHDAAVQDDSNMLLFNRQKQVIPNVEFNDSKTSVSFRVDVPKTLGDVFRELSYGDIVAIRAVYCFINEYNATRDGAGLFTGIDRYDRLETRVRQAASRSHTMRSFWDRLVDDMKVPIHYSRTDPELVRLFVVPKQMQVSALASMVRDFRSIVALARFWWSQSRDKDVTTASVEVSGEADESGVMVVDVPTVSGNGLRHTMLRAPLWSHLAQTLGFDESKPGEGDLPSSVEALFVNGGNIAAGAKQATNAHALAESIRSTFPGLDLLGGVTDAFDLGTSRVTVTPYIVCRENRSAVESLVPDSEMLSVSAFDLLDDVTLTRQATTRGVGQMIYNFETLAAGTQILVRFALDPWTPRLTLGAFATALWRFGLHDPRVGGQKRAGYGAVTMTTLDDIPGDTSAYDTYIREHADELRDAMIAGRLGTKAKVAS